MAVFLAAYDIPVSFHTLMRICGGNSIANVTSVTPGGAGVTQAFNVASLNGVTDATTATAYSVAQQLVTTAWNIILAIVLVVWASAGAAASSSSAVLRRGEAEGGRAASRAKGEEGREARGRDGLESAFHGLDRHRARARHHRGDAVADDADVLDAGARGQRPALSHRLLVLQRRVLATLAVGVLAAFVLGDAAASSHPSTPKTWVAIVDVVAAVLILTWVTGRCGDRGIRRGPLLRWSRCER
jgi:hypothetical protein